MKIGTNSLFEQLATVSKEANQPPPSFPFGPAMAESDSKNSLVSLWPADPDATGSSGVWILGLLYLRHRHCLLLRGSHNARG